jgi:mRNA interferase MazF
MAKKHVAQPKRGEVYLVSFDPTLGAEIQKTRPALILQNDISNRYSPITIVAALTSQFKNPPFPTDVLITPPEGGLKTQSAALLNQIRSIDKRRLIKLLGALSPETMSRVNDALRISLGFVEL